MTSLLVMGIADMRTHIVVPDGLIAAIDARVGQRKRSRFIAEAIEEKLRRADLIEAFEEVAGSLADVDIPGRETPESTSQWVHDMRHHPEKLVEYLARSGASTEAPAQAAKTDAA